MLYTYKVRTQEQALKDVIHSIYELTKSYNLSTVLICHAEITDSFNSISINSSMFHYMFFFSFFYFFWRKRWWGGRGGGWEGERGELVGWCGVLWRKEEAVTWCIYRVLRVNIQYLPQFKMNCPNKSLVIIIDIRTNFSI